MSTTLKAPRREPTSGRPDPDLAETVSTIIDDIRARGEVAVREHSRRLDGWEPASFALGPQELERALDRVPQQVLDDIEVVQEQVRTFARHQLDSMGEFEVETLPGVHLGQKHIPVGAVGAYVPGGRYPLLASAHMTVLTAKTAGGSSPPPRRSAARSRTRRSRRCTWPAPTRSTCSAGCRRSRGWHWAPRPARQST